MIRCSLCHKDLPESTIKIQGKHDVNPLYFCNNGTCAWQFRIAQRIRLDLGLLTSSIKGSST